MTTITNDKISAVDLSKVVLLNSVESIKNNTILSNADLKYQEERRKRKVRKLNFEVK